MKQKYTYTPEMLRVASQLYRDGRTYAQIARALKINDSQTCIVIKRARDEGLIRETRDVRRKPLKSAPTQKVLGTTTRDIAISLLRAEMKSLSPLARMAVQTLFPTE